MVPQLTFNVMTWLRGFLSESTGEASSSRLIALLSNLAALVLVFIVALTKRDIPAGAQIILLGAMGAGTVGYLGNKITTKAVEAKAASTTGETE